MGSRNLFISSEKAFLHMTECVLATIEKLSMTKRRTQRHLDHQVEAAQQAINWIKAMGITPEPHFRIHDIISQDITVRQYSDDIIARLFPSSCLPSKRS